MKGNIGLIIILVLVISAILVVAYNIQRFSEREIAQQFNSQQLIVAHEVSILIERFFKKTVDELDLTSFFLGNSPSKLNESIPLLKKLFSNLQVNEIIIKTTVLNKEGKIVAQYPDSEPLESDGIEDQSGKDFFIFSEQTFKPFISKVFMNKGVREITISFPILRQDNTKKVDEKEFLGVLVCYIDVKELAQTFLKPIRMGRTGYAWILNEDGTLLYHPSHSEMIWRNIFKNDGTCFQCHENFENEKRMLRGDKGTKESFVRTGEKKLIAYYPVKISTGWDFPARDNTETKNWSIAVSTPYSEVISLVKQSNQNIFLLTSLVIVVFFCGSIYLIWVNIKKVKAEEKMLWGEKVLEVKNRLQALFDGITDGISIIDKDHRVIAVNKGQAALSGKSEDELIGQICYEKFTDRGEPCEGCPVDVTLATGKPATGERIVRRDSGEIRYWSLLTFPLTDTDGKTTQVIKYVRDTTEQKRMNEEIEQSKRLSVIGEMIAGVAHEVKNPLQNISMGLTLLKYETEGSKECLETIENIMQGVKSLNSIVQDLLDFSKPMNLEIFDCDINDVLDEVLINMNEVFLKNRVKIVKNFYKGEKYIKIDGMKIKQVFINIIQNAVESMHDGGEIKISTEILSRNGTGYTEVRIKDTGSGISEENMGKIFEPFFTTKSKGVGLGMAIVQRIIRLHGGEIKVNSEVGKGTEFVVDLFDKSQKTLTL